MVDLRCNGCGWNTDTLNVFGVGLNERLLKEAKHKGRLYDYKVVEGHNTGLPTNSFDIAVAIEPWECLEDSERLIEEAKRLLKGGGHCLVCIKRYIGNNACEKVKKMLLKHRFNINLVFNISGFNTFLCAQKKPPDSASGKSYNDVTILLPTLNEEGSIADILAYLISHYKGCHIIVADDGSWDRTKEVVLNTGYKNLVFLDRSKKELHGLTASILDAIDLVKTKYFVVMDADSQHPPEKIEEIVNVLRLGNKLVIASRVGIDAWPLSRRVISYIGGLIGKGSLLLKGKNYVPYDILGGFFWGCY